ncbi:MAG: Hint domain-containing protein [Pseudomonadota bacterium]
MLNWMKGGTARPARRTVRDHAPTRAESAGARGIVAGTRIATNEGWRRAETICAGEAVMTFDNGPKPVRSVSRRLCPGPSAGKAVAQPLVVLAPGVAGNGSTLMLLPGQPILLESDIAERLYGDPFALLPATAMSELPDVSSMLSETPVGAVSLIFDDEQIVYADGQALLHCEGARTASPATLDDAVFGPATPYPVLPLAEARWLLQATELDREVPAAAPLSA